MTVASCLRAVLKEEHSWDVPTIAGLSPKEIRAIQLIDAVRHTFGFTQGDIVTGCSRFIQARLCARLVAHSSADAESPPETLARLIVSHVAKRSNLEIAEQVEVYDGDRLVTRLDCALVKVKIAIMYDGKHHLNRFQQDKDAEITLDLNQQGWKVIRVTAGTLNQLESRLVRLLDRR